jgi:hypothetical protein
MKLPQTGGCQCGKVRYKISEAPQLVYTCHCTDCQRFTSSAFSMGIVVPGGAALARRSNKGAPGVDGQDFADIERMGLSGGWLNWRLRSGGRHTDRNRSDACSYRRPTANSGRWASRPCGIGSA